MMKDMPPAQHKEQYISFWLLLSLAVTSALIYYFLGVSFDMSATGQILMTFFAFLFFLFAGRQGFYQLYIAMLGALTVFTALTCSFGEAYMGNSPLALEVVLGPWSIFIISFLISGGAWYFYEKKESQDRFALILLVLFSINWVVLGINASHFDDWKLENVLTVPFVLLVLFSHKWFRLSNISYGLIYLYMILHITGSHYTYTEVPFGDWMESFFEMSRNHYDRVVHFAFGLLLAYPLREIAVRIGNIRGFWGLYVPVEFVLATSAIYEIIEWWVAELFGGDLGIAYLGTQGDVWDAMKDMALAGLGSIIAMGVVLAVLLVYNRKSFVKEFKNSLTIKETEILGERVIQQFLDKAEPKHHHR